MLIGGGRRNNFSLGCPEHPTSGTAPKAAGGSGGIIMAFDYVGSPPSVTGNTMAPVRTNGVNVWQATEWPKQPSSNTGYVHPETLISRNGMFSFTFDDGDRIAAELSEVMQAKGEYLQKDDGTPDDKKWLRMCAMAEMARGIFPRWYGQSAAKLSARGSKA